MTEKKEGSLSAPTRDIVDWKSPEYLNEDSLDAEMRRQFEVCHSCRTVSYTHLRAHET